jgi:hypothetical protein
VCLGSGRWWDPSATVALTVSRPFDGSARTRVGLAFSIENWGGIGYQRPSDTYKRYVPMQYASSHAPFSLEANNNSQKTDLDRRICDHTRMDQVSDATEPDTQEALLRRQKMPAN